MPIRISDLAKLYEQRRDFAAATQTYQALLAVHPSHRDALYNLALQYEGQGDSRGARETVGRLLKLDPKYADAWYLAGRMAEKNNDLVEAAYSYRQAIAVKPSLVAAHYNLAFIHRSQNRPWRRSGNFSRSCGTARSMPKRI